jgi:hypothetical protein
VEIYEPALESTFFGHGTTLQDPSHHITGMEVTVVGDHWFGGQNGVICGVAKFIDNGVQSYTVALEPGGIKVEVPTNNLVPR